jgi:hypothetical protein
MSNRTRPTTSSIAVAWVTTAAVATALTVVAVLRLAGPSFADGATWSGLNQQGGPGFLFLLAGGVFGWAAVSPRFFTRQLSQTGRHLLLVLGAIVAFAATEGLGALFVPAQLHPIHPLTTSAALAFLVTGFVCDLLAHLPGDTESSPTPEGESRQPPVGHSAVPSRASTTHASELRNA